MLAGNLVRCLEEKLREIGPRIASTDALVNHSPMHADEQFFLPFTGNGHIGLALKGHGYLYISGARVLSVPTRYQPIVQPDFEDDQSGVYVRHEASVVELRDGLLRHLRCFKRTIGVGGTEFGRSSGDLCVSADSIVYAHRTHPSLLVQEIVISNPTVCIYTYNTIREYASLHIHVQYVRVYTYTCNI